MVVLDALSKLSQDEGNITIKWFTLFWILKTCHWQGFSYFFNGIQYSITKYKWFVEPSVRAEIIDHIPHIADFCCANQSELDGLKDAVPNTILPSLVRCLHDADNQVSIFIYHEI